jgi:hypothetical protein
VRLPGFRRAVWFVGEAAARRSGPGGRRAPAGAAQTDRRSGDDGLALVLRGKVWRPSAACLSPGNRAFVTR